MRAVLMIAVGTFLVGCHVLPDSRCSVENCRLVINSCRQQPAANPNLSFCIFSGLRVPEGYMDELGFLRCSDACNEQDLGETISCVAEVAPRCDAVLPSKDSAVERQAIVEAACFREEGGDEPADEACADECWTRRRSCDEACPTDSWDNCESCAADCGLEWAQCVNAC
jgi:hypothetical protein